MHELVGVVRLVRKSAELLKPLRKLVGGRRLVDERPILNVKDRDPFFVGPLQAAGASRIVKCPVRQDALQFQDDGWTEFVLASHELKRTVVVEDHPFAST